MPSEAARLGEGSPSELRPEIRKFSCLVKIRCIGQKLQIFGCDFDVALAMYRAVSQVLFEVGCKLKVFIRTRQFYTDAELISLYEAHLLAYLVHRAPAIYHAKSDAFKEND